MIGVRRRRMIATGDEFKKCKTRSLSATFQAIVFHTSHTILIISIFKIGLEHLYEEFFLLWQKICHRNLGTLLVCQSSFDLLQDFAEPPDKIRPVPSLFDSDLWSQLTPDVRQSVFHLETVTTHWSVNVTMPCFGRILSRTFPPTWFSDRCQKARFPGKSQLALSWSWFCVWWWERRRWQERDVFQSFSCKTRFWPTSSSSRLSFHFLLQSLLHHLLLLLPEETLLWIIFFHSWQHPSRPSLLQIDVVLYWQLTQRSATSKSNLLLDDFKAAGFAPWRSLLSTVLQKFDTTRNSLALVSLSHIAFTALA